MADVIRQGIDEASRGLQKEEENRLIEEGVFRQVPVVGSLLNWWSPAVAGAKVAGRTFDLSSGMYKKISPI